MGLLDAPSPGGLWLTVKGFDGLLSRPNLSPLTFSLADELLRKLLGSEHELWSLLIVLL